MRRNGVLALAVAGTLAVAALLGRSSQPAHASHCDIAPVVRGAMVIDQGLASYANSPLIRGHDTLVKVVLSQPQTRPSCATATSAVFLTGGTLNVTTGGTTLTATPVRPTPLPVSPFPLIAPYNVTPPVNSPGDPIFRVPADVLTAPSITGRYSATFTASITYESKVSSTAGAAPGHNPVTVTRNVTVEAPTNGWRLLVVPMGVPGQPNQFSEGALGAVASGMQTLARLSGVPKGTANGTAALGDPAGGVKYTVNQGDLVDVSGLLVDSAGLPTGDVVNGKFCGKASNFAPIEAQLGQFLQVWNIANPGLAADKAIGVSDELRSRGGGGCAEGMARVGANTAWVRAMHATGSPARTGSLLGMEAMHMIGGVPLARDDNFSPNHSTKTNADGAVGDPNTGFNVATGVFLSDDRTAMKLSSMTAWLDSNTLYEPADFQYSLCAFGGTATTECRATVPAPLGAAADVVSSFVMSGTTNDTLAGTHLVESYATSIQPGTLDPDGPYFLEYRNAGNPVVPRFGVPVFELQSHHDEDTGDSGTPADRVFSGAIPFPTAAQNATEIVFYKETGPSTRVTLFTLEQDGEVPVIVEAPTTTGGRGDGTTLLASANVDGVEGNSLGFFPALSADGNHVVFYSGATNLVPGHPGEIYVRDLETGEVEGVDVPIVEANPGGGNPSISGDGRFVVWQSSSNALVEGDTNGDVDIFRRDRQSDTTTRVSVDSAGAQVEGDSFFPDISDDGRFVAFHSSATGLVDNTDTNSTQDVYLKDMQTGVVTLVSQTASGAAGNADSGGPSVSADGGYVAFSSSATDLVTGDTNGFYDVFVRNLDSDTTVRASVVVPFEGPLIQGNGDSRHAALSAGGEYVAFETSASNFSSVDSNGQSDVFVRQLLEGNAMELVSIAPAVYPTLTAGASHGASHTFGPSTISADGRFVAFGSTGTDLVGGDTNEWRDAFVRDRERRETLRVSVTDDETQANNNSGAGPFIGTMSVGGEDGSDSRKVAFLSDASNLVSPATSGGQQVYVREEAPPATACGIDQAASIESVTPSLMTFVNDTSRSVDILWLNFAGDRVNYGTLAPGGSFQVSSWFTHPWVAVDHVTGRCYGYELADSAAETFTVTDSGGEGEQQVEAVVSDDEDVKADILLRCPVSGEQSEKHVVAVGVEPVNVGEGGSEFEIPTQATCPGGRFEIAFNDGVNSTDFQDAGPTVLDVDTVPPVASITGPRPGDEFLSSRAVGVWGTGRSEFYGELTGDELEWTVRQGTTVVATAVGAAPTFTLGAGTYTLELKATDPEGQVATDTHAFTVLLDGDKDGIPIEQETGNACVAAGNPAPDSNPQNAYLDGDLDGIPNLTEASLGTALCTRQQEYTGISLFVPTTIDLDSSDRTFSAQAMRVDNVDMRHVNRNTVRIVRLAGFDVSTNNAFRNTGFIAYKEYAAASFNQQAIIAFLRSKDIPHDLDSEQIEIVVSGQGSTPIPGQPNHVWTFVTPGTVKVQK